MALADGVVTRNTEFTLKRSDEGAEKLDDEGVAVFVKCRSQRSGDECRENNRAHAVLFADLIDSQGRGLGFFFRVDERHAVAQVFKAVKLR